MKFGLASALILSGVVFCTAAQAQSSASTQPKVTPKGPPQEQSIVFSSPDGITVSNALVPAAEAPQPDSIQDSMPEVPVTISGPQPPGVRYALPQERIISRDRTTDDPTDPNAALRSPTSAEIMGVPTLEQIFGLPRSHATNSQDRVSGVTTNIDFSDNSSPNDSSSDQSTTFEQGNGMFSSAQSTNSQSASGGFFGSAFGESVFGQHHNNNSEDSAFGAPPFEPLSPSQSRPDSFAPPADAGFSSDASAFAPKIPAPDSAFSAGTVPEWSPSTFSQPKSSLQSLPQLPSLSSYQNNNYSPPAKPSWEPKPPPWASSGPQLGTMTQPKF